MQKQINQLIHLPFWPKMGWVIFFAIFGTFSLTTTAGSPGMAGTGSLSRKAATN